MVKYGCLCSYSCKEDKTKAHDRVIKDSFEQINQEYKKELGALLTLNFQIVKELNVSQKF